MLIRRLVLSGDFADDDWTDPANAPPDTARPIKCTSCPMVFALQGRESEDADAAVVDVGALEVDAYVATKLGDGYVRGKTLVEADSALSARIKLVATEAQPGDIVRLNLTLTGVDTLPVLDVHLLSGGRPL